MKFKPHPYQHHAIQHIIDHPAAGLLLDMGLGKTVSTLTAVDMLLNDFFEVSKVLVIAPKRVAEDTWSAEVAKWDHLKHLIISKVLGSEAERKAALKAKADIYVINRENVVWLVGYYGTAFPFDMLIIDELSSFKNAQSARFKALRQIRPRIARVVGLTGTPMPNGLLDLWPQLYLLDQGERLGKTITGYRDAYFTPGKRNGHVVYSYDIRGKNEDPLIGPGYYEKVIFEKISDICISMKSEDYLDLPDRIDQVVRVNLPPAVKELYDTFEREQVLALLDEEITAVNAAALIGKLLQFAGGAVYREDKTYHEVHTEKLQVLQELIEAANGQPVLITYWFKHERDRIMRELKAYKPVEVKTAEDVKLWNSGKVQVMLGHPQSMGHGLNMQDGGNNLFGYSNIWSSELYLQVIKRLHRQGQTKPVFNKRLVCVGTIDEDVVEAQERKLSGQEVLMQATKAVINKYR
jgi:SNF2 family DNA or RNA helicase